MGKISFLNLWHFKAGSVSSVKSKNKHTNVNITNSTLASRALATDRIRKSQFNKTGKVIGAGSASTFCFAYLRNQYKVSAAHHLYASVDIDI